MKLSDFKKMETRPGSFQTVLRFGNQVELSVISGNGSYSSETAPYEIAVFRNGEFAQLPGITCPEDDVRGYLVEKDVDLVIKKLVTITRADPVQV